MGPATLVLPELLDRPSVEALRVELAAARDGDAIILAGADDRFCLGMEFESAASGLQADMLRVDLQSFACFLRDLLTAPRPTLALVDGAALGGGLGLAAACDFVLATGRSSFGLPEALYGLAPAIIRPALLTRLTAQRLNMLLFTCHARGAEEALALGLVDRIVPPGELQQVAREILRQFRRARSQTVIAARRWNSAAIAEALDAGVAETGAALASETVIAALRAAASEEELPWTR